MNQTSHSSAQASTDQRASSAHAHQKEAFYSPAADILIAARRSIAEWSIARAHARILKTKEIRTSAVLQQIEDKTALDLYDKNKQMTLCASEFGDSRALTTVRYSASGDFLATGSLACNVKIWDSSASKCRGELVGHVERITSVAWMPPGVQESHRNFLASTAADSSCILWDTSLLTRRAVNASSNNDGEEMGLIGSRSGPMVQKFIGHQGVISDCDIHPMGRHIGTAGQDFTWRLWDIETGSEVLLQDGHIKECSSISFQCDGSLVLTTDWAGVALLWDLRSGQCIHVFQGHVQKIVSSCFSPNGFQVATGSIDHMVRIWDLRKKKCWYTLPAHSNVISDLKFSKSGELLLTSSFDGTTKLWNSRDFDLIRTLSGHNGKVMGCDISPNELEVATAGFDRTLKIWGKQ